MSHNQSRAGRSESTQYRKTGRSGSSNQQRQFSGGASTKGGGGATDLSNRSFKEHNSNAQVGQPNTRSSNVDSSNSSTIRAVQNGGHQQPTNRVSDAPVTITSSNAKPTDASTQKTIPKAPSSNVSAGSSESKALTTPGKDPGDPSKSFPLQFGSISPVFMNGMQVPPRTSSAPPNLDEQKKAQARHESLRAAPAMPIPSIPKQHMPRKDAGILDQPNAGEAQLISKSKREPQASVALSQKPALHPIPSMPMQLPFHQPQIPVQFGGPNPQIQSQAMSGPMPMPMSLPLGNPPLPHSMFAPGLQPHPMQPQGMMHQGQSLKFPPQMGPQIPPQLGNMGMNMAPQFPRQPAVNYSGSRKPVKITHPETHEELRLVSSPAPSSHPNVQSQSQPISSFPPNRPMNLFSSSYNGSSIFPPVASSVPLNSAQVPPTSQPPRLYNQVTVKPHAGSHGDNMPPTGSLSRSQDSVFPEKETDPSSLSSSQQPKPDLGNSGQQDQVDALSTSLSSFPSQLPGAEVEEAKSTTNLVSETAKESLSTTVAASCEASNLTSEGAKEEKVSDMSKSLGTKGANSRQSKPETVERKEQGEGVNSESSKHNLETSLRSLSLESPVVMGNIEEHSDREVSSSNGVLSEHSGEKLEESSVCSNGVKFNGNLAVPTCASGGENTESSVPVTSLSVQNDQIFTSDVPSSVPGSIDTRETSAPVLVPSPREGTLKPENEDAGGLVSPPPSTVKDKILPDANVAKGTVPRVKKKQKELYRKAEAAGTSSDLYNAYKGPEKKKEDITSAEGSENTSSIGDKQTPSVRPQENAVPSEKPAQSKLEPDDWEDAAEISSPQLETSKNENQDNDGSTTKRYSRDFLLKFSEQCSDLPEGFEVTSDIADTLVSSVTFPRDSYPSPGRNIDRPGGGSRQDRRGSGLGDEDRWNKFPGPVMSGRGDMRADVGYAGNVVGFRPGQGGNYGVPRNPRAQTPVQNAGGILSGPMQNFGPQSGGLQRNNSDSDRWQRATGFQRGLMPSPHTPMVIMHKAEKKYEVGKVTDEEQAKQRQLKGILNKLTPQNFEKLFEQVKQVNIDNVITLSGVISQIFDKALMEPTFCEMYANFCFHLAADLPELSVDSEKITFKRLLLNKCQEEFERGEREEEEANKADEEGEVKQTAEEREEKRLKVRRRMLGNIRLIGELYKKRVLTERIMHECINKLLGQYQNPDEENIEALCKLMSTIGEMIDHPKAKEHIDAYFDIMTQLSNNMKLSSRVRFMLKDAIDLRKNKWQQRRKVEGPKKIEEVHRDAAQERQAQSGRLSRAPSMGNSSRRGPPMEYAPRSPNMLSSPSPQSGGYRAGPPHLRGYGSSQDARMEERLSSVPLPQRPLGDDSITLGPQGGLARGMAFRGQPSLPNVPFSEMPSPQRMGSSQNGFSSMPERAAYGQREDLMPRYMQDRFAAPPAHDQSHPQERNVTHANRELRNNTDRGFDRSLPDQSPARDGPPTSTQSVSSDKVWTEERLRDKSLAAIREFYSARDEKEVALCIKDLNNPSFYPSMISLWITDSFERKDMEREILTKLLIDLTKTRDGIISRDQLIKGFESVLAVLEDAVNDAPKAAEFLGRIFAKVMLENVVSLSEIGQLIYEGGEEEGSLVEIGLGAEVLGCILDIIKSEKGDSVLNEIRLNSNLQLEKFRPPGSKRSLRIDKFI